MSYYGGWAGGDDYRVYVDVSTSASATAVTIKVTTGVDVWYGYDGGYNTWAWATVNGQTASVGSQCFDGNRSLVSKTVTINRTTSKQTIGVSGKVSSYAGDSSWSGSVTVDPLATYAVKYSANGGSGAPAQQTKVYGKTLTLSSTKPSRTGYSFVKWNTKADGTGTSYNSGASYTGNAALTLYAIWKIESYTITYNANGQGATAPAKQTKTYNQANFKLAAAITRTGYSFVKWNTKADGSGTSYNASAVYTGNASITLYAIWKANTYTVSYNANGGTGAPASQTKTYGITLTLTNSIPTRLGYSFVKWNTQADGTGTSSFAAGGSYTPNQSMTLYAIWKAEAPTLVVSEAYRSDNQGEPDDEGVYASVTCRWTQADAELGGTVYISSSIRERGEEPSQTDPTASVTQTGTSGTVVVIAGGNLEQDKAYTIRVEAWNSLPGSTIVEVDIGTAWYPIDVKAGGHGVAIGGVAQEDGLVVNMHETVHGNLSVDNRLTIGNSDATVVDLYAKTASRTGSVLRVIDGADHGAAVLLSGGGSTYVGGGESTVYLQSALGQTTTEDLHLSADGSVHLYSNCNTIANRKGLTFSNDGTLYAPDGSFSSQSKSITMNVTPSTATTGFGFYLRESAGSWITRMVPRFYNNGNEFVLLETHRVVSGTDKYAQLYLGLDPSGNVLVTLNGTGAAMAWKKAMNTCSATAIFTGKNASNGTTIGTYTSVFDYRLFWAQLSGANQNWCLCYRIGDTSTAGYIRGVGALDTGTNSYVFKTNISVSTAGVLKVVASSQHILNASVSGTGLYVSALYGIK